MNSGLRYVSLFLVFALSSGVLPMPATAAPPPVPTPQSPGYSTQFGEVISTLTPTLQWSSVSGANNYHVAIRQYAGSWDSGPIVLDQGYIYSTSYKVPSGVLEAGASYRWTVRAFNSGGEASDWSSRLYFQTTSSAPTSTPTLYSPGYTSAPGETLTTTRPTFSWSSVSGATSYNLYISKAPYGEANQVRAITGITGTSHTLTSSQALPDNTDYRWTATGQNSGGEGPYSTQYRYFGIETTTTTTTTSKPTHTPTLYSPGYTSAPGETQTTTRPTFSWSSVSGATSYNLYVSKAPYGGANQVLVKTGLTGTSYTPTSGEAFADNTDYRWTATGQNSGGEGPESTAYRYFRVQTTTTISPPSTPPTLYSPGHTSAPGETLTTTRPTFSWSSVDDATSYNLYISKAPYGEANQVRAITGISGTSHTLTSSQALPDNTDYRWTATGQNSGGEGPYSPQYRYFGIQTTTTISPPSTAPTLYSPGYTSTPGEIHSTTRPGFSWSSVDDATSYNLYVSKAPYGAANQVLVKSGLSGTSYTPTSSEAFTDNTDYRWTATGQNSGGEGPYSTAYRYFRVQTTTTGETSPSATLPDAPRNLDAYGDTGQNYLGWNAPTSDGGTAITNYRVFRGTSPDSSSIVTSGGCANLGVTFACTDTGLVNGQAYYYTVRAVNGIGQGAPSNQVSATTTGTSEDEQPPLPDLVVHPISFNPNPPVAGQPVDVTCSYSNSPNAASTQTGFGVQVSIDGGTPKTATSQALLPGRSGERTFTFTGAYGAGLHTVVCEVNKDRAVAESNHEDSGTTDVKEWVGSEAEPEEPTTPVYPDPPESGPLTIPTPVLYATSGPGKGQITLTWDIPHGGLYEDVRGFRVYGGIFEGKAEPRKENLVKDVGLSQAYVHDSTPGFMNYFRVVAYKDYRAGEPSNLVSTQGLYYGYFFIHGVCSNGEMWTDDEDPGYDVFRKLSRGSVPVWNGTIDPVEYSDPPSMSLWLETELEMFSKQAFGEAQGRIVVVGHSLGGLLARELMGGATTSKYIHRVVTLDSPDIGASGAIQIGSYGRPACYPGWPSFINAHLGRDAAWLTGMRNNADDPRLVRALYGQCDWGLPNVYNPWATPDCQTGNSITTERASDWNGAVLLSYAGSGRSPEWVSQANVIACNARPSSSTGGASMSVVVPGWNPVGTLEAFHSEGTSYFDNQIVNLALNGIDGLRGQTGAMDCRMAGALEKGSIGATISPNSVAITSDPRVLEMTPEVHSEGMVVVPTALLDKSGAPKTLQVKVNSEEHKGRSIVINLPYGYLSIYKSDQVLVKLDGKVVQQASSYESALDPAHPSNGGQARYWVLSAGSNGLQVLVAVPSYSERTIEISAIEDPGQPFISHLGLIVLATALLLTVGVAYGMGRRQGRKGT